MIERLNNIKSLMVQGKKFKKKTVNVYIKWEQMDVCIKKRNYFVFLPLLIHKFFVPPPPPLQ